MLIRTTVTPQLRHYISTADPDTIYVAVNQVIYSIQISTRKREIVTIVPFEPKCLTAGLGWIGIGGTEHGDCAFVRIAGRAASSRTGLADPSHTDVDTPLPLDLDPSSRRSLPWNLDSFQNELPLPRSNRRRLPDLQIKEFGGKIVNSVTLHRMAGDGDMFADEDLAILRFVAFPELELQTYFTYSDVSRI
jgi:hypothetical protein